MSWQCIVGYLMCIPIVGIIAFFVYTQYCGEENALKHFAGAALFILGVVITVTACSVYVNVLWVLLKQGNCF